MKKKIGFSATGLVYGNHWGGGQGAYPSKRLIADSKEELLEKANKKLADGSLDSGMGYESLIGAVLNIAKTTIIDFKGKPFTNTEYEIEFIGELTPEQKITMLELIF